MDNKDNRPPRKSVFCSDHPESIFSPGATRVPRVNPWRQELVNIAGLTGNPSDAQLIEALCGRVAREDEEYPAKTIVPPPARGADGEEKPAARRSRKGETDPEVSGETPGT